MTEKEKSNETVSNTLESNTGKSINLYNHLEDKTEESKKTFNEINECIYLNDSLGSSGHYEYMSCDCEEIWDPRLKQNLSCSIDSNCINRITSVECFNKCCGCGLNCSNQNFQKKKFKKVSVIKTNQKGYGLRADENINIYEFIYEYSGEVIDDNTFRKKMVEYNNSNIKHFYFMMLKNDSFIDSTIKGSLARFCNHSCNPNSYVDKWVVGDKLRMGIFAKRNIIKGEEITFNYNVDRYGAESQECYCGEYNCKKILSGKTQTDSISFLSPLVIEALGITYNEEKLWMKENKSLIKKQDNEQNKKFFLDYFEPKEITETEVSKLMGVLMKSQDIEVIKKLVERIYKTNDSSINTKIVKFHGYKTFSSVMMLVSDVDDELVIMIFEILKKWPKITKNKIFSSQIENVVSSIKDKTKNNEIRDLSINLLEDWSKLKLAYRIPKTMKNDNMLSYKRNERSNTNFTYESNTYPKKFKSFEYYEPNNDLKIRPKNFYSSKSRLSKDFNSFNPDRLKIQSNEFYKKKDLDLTKKEVARIEEESLKKEKEVEFQKLKEKEKLLYELISNTNKQDSKNHNINHSLKKNINSQKTDIKNQRNHDELTSIESSLSLKTQWTYLFAKYIPNLMKIYEKEIGKANIKGCAKDLVTILVNKELKKDPKIPVPKKLDKNKLKKIIDFINVFMEKFLAKFHAKIKQKKETNINLNSSNEEKKRVDNDFNIDENNSLKC